MKLSWDRLPLSRTGAFGSQRASMSGRIFVVQGDISRFAADAVAYSTSTQLATDGFLYSAFQRNVAGFEEAFSRLGETHGGRCQVGDAFWLPLPNRAGLKPKGVVVTPSAGRGPSPEEKRPAAVAAALTTAVEHLPRPGKGDSSLLVALPTFGFGLGGDRWRRMESGRSQLLAADNILKKHPQLSVAFVAYTADSYQVLLLARREAGLEQDDLLQAPPVAELINALRKSECVVFVGAGLSQEAGLPGWERFIHHLAEDLGAPPTSGLEHFLDVAQWYVERKGEERLADRIRGFYGPGAARPTLPHYLLMSLPVRVVITTNYDDLLEQSLEGLRRYPTVIKDEGDVARTGHGEGVSVVKLHGDAASSRRFVLSRDDFDRFMRQRPAMASLLEALLLNHSFFFVGYGLRDPNFRQIYGRIADMLQNAQRKAFAVTVDPTSEITPFVERQWANKGVHLLPMPGATLAERVRNLWRFLDQLANAVSPRSLFLTNDAGFTGVTDEAPRLETLRELLRDQIGGEVERIIREIDSAATDRELRLTAQVLGFLTEHGWRPSGKLSLTNLWERLARRIDDPYEKQRLLIRALRHAEHNRDIVRLRQHLAELDRGA